MNILSACYAPPDGGIGDFCLAHRNKEWHLFHIYREYGKPCDCQFPGQESKIGHAFSKDLISWTTRKPAITARKGKWDSAHLWAPTVVEYNGLWHMLYTGMKDDINQKIGLAVSADLENWEYPCPDSVIDVSLFDWADSSPDGYTNCRDPYIFRWENRWLCYYTAKHKDGLTALGVAASKDLTHWEDCGTALKRPWMNGESNGTYLIESPCVFQFREKIFLVFNQGGGIRYTVSEDPFNFNNAPVEVFHDGIYNFEILDVKTGLFAYAGGGYYSCLRLGYADFSGNKLQFKETKNEEI